MRRYDDNGRTLRLPAGEGSFAAATVEANQSVVSPDLHTEDRFAVPSFLLEGGAVCGASSVLRVAGRPVGSLCVYDTETRGFDDDALVVLQSIANVVSNALERDEAHRQLARRSVTDELTGLANRALFVDRLGHALERRKRHGGTLAVMFADLDRFKDVNDALGRIAGDELLRRVRDLLVGVVRSEDTIARVGGDEFAVLCEDISEPGEALILAEQITEAVSGTPIRVDTREMFVSVSIGIALPDSGSSTPQDLLRDADAAMHRAKSAGGARAELFDPGLRDEVMPRLDLTQQLRTGIEQDELLVYYQPEVTFSGDVVWAEALVRWQHPERGLLGPDAFVPLAETSGLIVPLGTWVLERVVAQLERWSRLPAWQAPSAVSVNISARQLVEDDLVARTRALLDGKKIPPGSLWFELTETALLREPERSLEVLNELKAMGIGLAVDDFGTGYASLAYARKLPVDGLKIDKTFVDGVCTDARDLGIVRAVIEMARSLGILAIAEGVESQDQFDLLREMGCHFAQGYLLARPGPAADIEAWTEQWHRSQRSADDA